MASTMISYTFKPAEEVATVSQPTSCLLLPIPRDLSVDKQGQHARRFSGSIFADWTKLNAILKRFEDIIQKRWMKKSMKQRREILLKAWPDMSQTHRPDFAASRKRNLLPESVRAAAFLWPAINLEDLLERNNLLHFLHSRGSNLPHVFVHTDMQAAHLGHDWDSSKPEKGMYHRMLLVGCKTPSTYGELISLPIDSRNEPVTTIPCKAADLGPMKVTHDRSVGLLVLEIQQRLYSFLLSCANAIVHDIQPQQHLLAPHRRAPAVPEPAMGEWISLAAHMRQIPYRAPPELDLERLKTLVNTQKSYAEDHFWMLREDPGYFNESVQDELQHNRRARCRCGTSAWHTMAAQVLLDASVWLIRWKHISDLLNTLPPMHVQLQNANRRSMRLPEKEEAVWAQLYELVKDMTVMPIERLGAGFANSPRMRHCFEWDEDERQLYTVPNKLAALSEAEQRIFKLFDGICIPCSRELHTLSLVVSEAEYMFEKDPRASQLVDPWLVYHFSNLAMLSELYDRIAGLQPWFPIWQAAGVDKSPSVQLTVCTHWAVEDQLVEAFGVACKEGAFDAFDGPQNPTWEYPASKKKTEKNVEQMRIAEAALDQVWHDIFQKSHALCGMSLKKALNSCMSSPRVLQRTPPWVAPPEQLEVKPLLKEVDQNIPRFATTEYSTKAYSVPTLKHKAKTRGVARLPEGVERAQETSPRMPDNEALIDQPTSQTKVPKRAYKVLSALFPACGVENHQRKEIEWNEFLQALDAIGLCPEKLYGSVWLFKPKSKGECLVEMERSIQFHEPKEVRHGSKIPAGMVRTFGRRLKHAFGWENGMFVSE